MNTDTGEIKSISELKRMFDKDLEEGKIIDKSKWKEINPENLSKRNQDKLLAGKKVKIGRNEPCPCGSGRKFKFCCRTKS